MFDLAKICWARLKDILRLPLQKTSWSIRLYLLWSYLLRRRLQDVLIKTIYKIVLAIRLQGVLKMYWRHVEVLFNTFSRRHAKTYSRSFQNGFKDVVDYVLQRCLQDIFKMSSRCNQDDFNTFRDILQRVLTTEWFAVIW